MTIITRDALTELNGIYVDGVWHGAGQVKDFRSSPLMSQYLPEHISLSWVSLQNSEPLEDHFHPLESFVLIVDNDATYKAEKAIPLQQGSIVRVPPFVLHSFEAGRSQKKFWGLAWNMTKGHLFAQSNQQRLVFFKDELKSVTDEKSSVVNLFETSENNPLSSYGGLNFSVKSIAAKSTFKFVADEKSWLIISQDGCLEMTHDIVYKAGDFVLLNDKDLEIKNTTNESISIFTLKNV